MRLLTAILAVLVLVSPAAARQAADAANILADVKTLSADEMQGRAPGTAGSALARAYITRRLTEIGVKPSGDKGFEQAFTYKARDGKKTRAINLIGRIDGTTPEGPALVVMAHYDHLGVRAGQIFNGADDNASGVAALLAVAESFRRAPPAHTVIFAIVDAEEAGLRGARHFVAHPPGPRRRISLAVNFDMLAKNAKNELYVSGASHFPYLKARLEAVAARASVTLRLGHDTPVPKTIDDWTDQSDHYAFHEKGVPWVYFGVEDHSEYHKANDDFDTIPQDFYRRSVLTVIDAVRALEADLGAIADKAASKNP